MINFILAIKDVDLSDILNDDRDNPTFPLTEFFFNDATKNVIATFDWSSQCKTKVQGATTTKIVSVNVSDVEAFEAALPPNVGSKVFQVIGAWHYDGTQYGLIPQYDGEGIFTGYANNPDVNDGNGVKWTLQLDTWLDDYAPDIDEITTARAHYTTTGEVQDINLKSNGTQKPRDWVVR